MVAKEHLTGREEWLSKLLTEDGVWQTILRRKYVLPQSFFSILMETWGFAFLGWPYGNEEAFL
jgi:hypothetical protein